MSSLDPRRARFARPSAAVLLGLAAVAAARLLTLPESFWEYDEFRFAEGVLDFDPLHHRPHPPGYPVLIGLGKLFNAFLGDPFASLVALSVVSCLIGYLALVSAFRRIAPGDSDAAERAAVAGAVLFHLSPTMLIYGPLPLSDSPTLMFLALALAAAARLADGGSARAAVALGAFASAAVGCRPQLAVAVLPMLAVALGQVPEWRKRGITLAVFTLISLLWFVPLTLEVGGISGLLAWLTRQADTVLTYDAEASRGDYSVPRLIARFVAHPWGAKWTSVPMLALAALGMTALARARRWSALPLFGLAGLDLALGLAVMNPTDAVRYALPSEIAVAFAAGVGCMALTRLSRVPLPNLAYAMAALLAAAFAMYASPVLRVRSTTSSPVVQAADWAKRSLPPGTTILVDKNLNAPASFLFPGYTLLPAEKGLERAPDRRAWLLGDGESGWPGAAAFRWPESDAYGKLTRNLYRVITLSPVPPERMRPGTPIRLRP
jgi:hypothetical protein